MRAAILAVALLIAAGCQSTLGPTPHIILVTPAPTAAPDPTPTSEPTPTPEPTAVPPMTMEEAAARYLDLATRANKTFDDMALKYIDARGSWKSLKAFQSYHKTAAILTRRFADNIRKTVWPTEVASDIKLMLKQLAAEERAMLVAATATNWAEATTLQRDVEKAVTARGNTSNLVRADLGLPSVPVD